MTYAELLGSDEWKAKRLSILERDKFLCQNCSNESLIKNCKEGLASFSSLSLNPLQIYFDDSLAGSIYVPNDARSILPRNLKVLFYIEEEVIKLIAFKSVESNKYIYVPGLHVHHKYYQETLNPWEYSNDALITFCWVCHEKLHATTKVPKLDKHGHNIGLMTLCHRCHGAGKFPEYKHVQAGICFRCNGACYEELINEKPKYNQPTDDLPF